MLDSYFTYDGRDSSAFDIIIKSNRIRRIPEKKMNIYNVPGRVGDIVTSDGTFAQIEISYDIKINCGRSQIITTKDLSEKVRDIATWLHGANPASYSVHGFPATVQEYIAHPNPDSVYRPLRDTFRTGGFHRAYFKGPADFASNLEKYGEGTIIFSADPRFFLDSGMEWQDITDDFSEVLNPTPFPASPLLHLQHSLASPPSLMVMAGRSKGAIGDDNNGKIWYTPAEAGAVLPLTNAELALEDGGIVYLPVKVKPNSMYAFRAVTDRLVVVTCKQVDKLGNKLTEPRQLRMLSPEAGSTEQVCADTIATLPNTRYIVFAVQGISGVGDGVAKLMEPQLQEGYFLPGNLEWTNPGTSWTEEVTYTGYVPAVAPGLNSHLEEVWMTFDSPYGDIYVDCDQMCAYGRTNADLYRGIYLNDRYGIYNDIMHETLGEYIRLMPGETGYFGYNPSDPDHTWEQVQIQPRWWML